MTTEEDGMPTYYIRARSDTAGEAAVDISRTSAGTTAPRLVLPEHAKRWASRAVAMRWLVKVAAYALGKSQWLSYTLSVEESPS